MDHRSKHTIETLGSMLLDLHRAAHEIDLGVFPRCALELLKHAVPFDFAWWGMARQTLGAEQVLHSSFSYDLPGIFVERWQQIMADKAGERAAHAPPDITRRYLAAEVSDGSAFRATLSECRVREALITTHEDRQVGLVTFLAMYRTSGSPPFREQERLLTQTFMPHLVHTRNVNWLAQLDRTRPTSAARGTVMAVADREGVLYAADSRFQDVVHSQWSDWRGPHLPQELRQCIRTHRKYDGTALIANSFPANDLYLLQLHPRSALDRLSARESTVAREFSMGRSHKEIAAELSLAPATIRHHLRSVYDKLDVSDKAELACIFGNYRSINN
jgi:DNA-binding CsgD family transcriptional regulator